MESRRERMPVPSWALPLGRAPGVPPHLQHPATWGPPSAADALAGALATAGRSAPHGCAAKVLARHVQRARAAGLIPDWAAAAAAEDKPSTSHSTAPLLASQNPLDTTGKYGQLAVRNHAEEERRKQLASRLVEPLMSDHRLLLSLKVQGLVGAAAEYAQRPRALSSRLLPNSAQEAEDLNNVADVLQRHTLNRLLQVVSKLTPDKLGVTVLPAGASHDELTTLLSKAADVFCDLKSVEIAQALQGAPAADSGKGGKAKGKAARLEAEEEKEEKQRKERMHYDVLLPGLHGLLLEDQRMLPRAVNLIATLSVLCFTAWDSSKTLPAFALQVEQVQREGLAAPLTLLRVCNYLASKGPVAPSNAPSIRVRAGGCADDLARRVVDEVGGKQGACRLMAQGDEAVMAIAVEVLRKARETLSAAKRPKELYAFPYVTGSSAASLAPKPDKGSGKGGRKGPGAGAAGGAGDNKGSSGGGGEGAAVSVAGSWDPRASHTICFYCVVLRPGQVDKAWLMPVPEPSLKARLRDVLEGEAVRMMNGRDGTEHVCARFEEVVREAQRERDEEDRKWRVVQEEFAACVRQAVPKLQLGSQTASDSSMQQQGGERLITRGMQVLNKLRGARALRTLASGDEEEGGCKDSNDSSADSEDDETCSQGKTEARAEEEEDLYGLGSNKGRYLAREESGMMFDPYPDPPLEWDDLDPSLDFPEEESDFEGFASAQGSPWGQNDGAEAESQEQVPQDPSQLYSDFDFMASRNAYDAARYQEPGDISSGGHGMAPAGAGQQQARVGGQLQGQDQGRAVAGTSYCGATSTTSVHERLAPTFLAPRTSPGPQCGAGLRWGRWGGGLGSAAGADMPEEFDDCGEFADLDEEQAVELKAR